MVLIVIIPGTNRFCVQIPGSSVCPPSLFPVNLSRKAGTSAISNLEYLVVGMVFFRRAWSLNDLGVHGGGVEFMDHYLAHLHRFAIDF